MKVKIHPFEWNTTNSVELRDFFNYIKNNGPIKKENKICALAKLEAKNYWAGLILTARCANAFCKLTEDDKGFKLTHEELEQNSNLAEFNFFIINDNTGRGLYQHYYQSPFISTATRTFKSIFKDLCNENKKNEMENYNNDSKKIKKINKKYNGTLKYTILLTPETFEKRISELKRAKSFSFEFTTIKPEERKFCPASGLANRVSHNVFFSKDTNWSETINAIRETLNKNPLKRGKVNGIDQLDEDVVIKYNNCYEVLDKYEFDDIIKKINIDSNNLDFSIRSSDMVQKLLSVSQNASIMLEVETV
ncbi:MAG: hypothetical protein ACLFMR_05505 [Desulfohalobiaceae bacterium]